jgi:prevent-host-death family protein
MTIHVNIGEAKTRLSELVAAALRGEEVVVDRAGEPQVRLVPVDRAIRNVREKRMAAFGMYADRLGGPVPDVRSLKMTDAEWDERDRARFGAPD